MWRTNVKGSRINNFTELAPGFRSDLFNFKSDEDGLETGCENVKLFMREP